MCGVHVPLWCFYFYISKAFLRAESSFVTQAQISCASPPETDSHLEEEWVGVVSQLAQQSGLRRGVYSFLTVLQRWVHLAGGQVQLPAEGDSHHIHVISAVAKGARQGDEHWRAEETQ